MSSLQALLTEYRYIKDRAHQLADPETTLNGKREDLLIELVGAVNSLDERLSVMCARIEKLEGAAQPNAQPAVASNTGSGAAPEAPDAHPASDGAAQPPTAAGTAPESQPQA